MCCSSTQVEASCLFPARFSIGISGLSECACAICKHMSWALGQVYLGLKETRMQGHGHWRHMGRELSTLTALSLLR